MPRTPLGCRGALGQTGYGEHGEASLGTFCSWKRPSMMLLHRSSSRLRSTTWSRTSSPGLAARRPRKVRLACIPPHQAQPLIAALVPIPLTWVPGPDLLSHPHEVPDMQFAHRVGHMQPLELKEQPWPVPRPGVETGGPDQGRPLATTPASSPLLPPPHLPLGFTNVHTQQHPVLSRPELQRWLLGTPFAGATTGGEGGVGVSEAGTQVPGIPPPPANHSGWGSSAIDVWPHFWDPSCSPVVPLPPPPHSSAEAAPGTSGSSPGGSSGPMSTFSELRPSDSASFWASSRPSGVREYLVDEHRSPFFTHTWQALLPAPSSAGLTSLGDPCTNKSPPGCVLVSQISLLWTCPGTFLSLQQAHLRAPFPPLWTVAPASLPAQF